MTPGAGGPDDDVEAMLSDSDDTFGNSAVITGFPLDGRDWTSIHIDPNDIGIDVSSADSMVKDFDSSVTTITPYEYGIDIPGTYSSGPVPADVEAVSLRRGVYHEQHELNGDAWVSINGTAAGDAAFACGFPGAGRFIYAFSVLLADLGLEYGDYVTVNWTMECGNDFSNPQAVDSPVLDVVFSFDVRCCVFCHCTHRCFSDNPSRC